TFFDLGRPGGVHRRPLRVCCRQIGVGRIILPIARLRDLMRDPLLVRVGPRMDLTPRAQALRVPLAQALDAVRGLFVTESFDPATSTRRFVLMLPDLVTDLVMPPLIARIGGEAPRVRFDLVAFRGPAAMTDELARGLDLIIACLPDAF